MATLTASEASLRSLTHLDKLFDNLTAETAPAFSTIINSTKGEPLIRLTLAAISRLTSETIDARIDKAEDYDLLLCTLANASLKELSTADFIELMTRAAGEVTIQHILVNAIVVYFEQEASKK